MNKSGFAACVCALLMLCACGTDDIKSDTAEQTTLPAGDITTEEFAEQLGIDTAQIESASDTQTNETPALPEAQIQSDQTSVDEPEQKSDIRMQAEAEVAEVAAQAAEIEEKLHATYIQAELNQYSGQWYTIWDDALNRLWGYLQDTLSESEMDALTQEELEWIAYKETEIDAAGNEFAGGSMELCARSMRGAELTESRVYELLEYLP